MLCEVAFRFIRLMLQSGFNFILRDKPEPEVDPGNALVEIL